MSDTPDESTVEPAHPSAESDKPVLDPRGLPTPEPVDSEPREADANDPIASEPVIAAQAQLVSASPALSPILKAQSVPRRGWLKRAGATALILVVLAGVFASLLHAVRFTSGQTKITATPTAPALATLPHTAAPDFLPLDLTRDVNPFIGTQAGQPPYGFGGSAGNTFPGATLPFGMVQFSPDTAPGGLSLPAGYAYTDGRIQRFSLTHMSGTGCQIMGDVPFMPTTAQVTDAPPTDPYRYSAPFAHRDEHASPGAYSVKLGTGINVELTTTLRTGLARITYPSGQPQTLLLDSGDDLRGVQQAHAQFVSATEIRGFVTGGPFCAFLPTSYTVYFDAQLSRPASAYGSWGRGGVAPEAGSADGSGSGLYAQFDPRGGNQLQVSVGLSYVSAANAAANLAAETTSQDFDTLRAAADTTWNTLLNNIQATGGTNADEATFHTALYHSLLAPNVFSDADGQYTGFDGRVHTAAAGHAYYANFSGWDIYRSEAPLLALLAPAQTSDMMQSLVEDAAESGALPRWPIANGDTGIMVGDPSAAILADAVAFGATGFDATKALHDAVAAATDPNVGTGVLAERAGLSDYLALGYVPIGASYVPASTSLEYYSEDYAVAALARTLGDDADAKTIAAHAAEWPTLYDPATGQIEPRNGDGSFSLDDSQFIEGNAAQYTWMLPFDMGGLVARMGGQAQAQQRLDTFFSQFASDPFAPYAWMGNEPSLGTPWAYDFTGSPWKTQATVRQIMTSFYGDSSTGIPGNDDLGSLSSWYVWAALGMYPLIPGHAGFVLGSPLFPEVTLTLGSRHIALYATGAARKAPYIQSMQIDGVSSSSQWLPLAKLTAAHEIDFTLSATPNKSWGASPSDAPPSLSVDHWPTVAAPGQ